MPVRRLSAALLFGGLVGLTAGGQPPTAGTGSTSQDPPKLPSPVIPEKAVEFFRKKEYVDCYKELEKAAKDHPSAPHPRVQLAIMFFDSRDGQNARAQLEAAAMDDVGHPDLYLTNANFAYGEGRITDAILNLTAALSYAENPRWNPNQRSRFTSDARNGLAYCFEARRDWASAKEQIQALITADGKNTMFKQRLGFYEFQLGKLNEAFAAFSQAYKDDQTLDPPELRMGLLWIQNPKPDMAKAEEWLKKAIAAYPKEAKVFRGYAEFLMNDGRLNDADAQLKTAESLAPTARDTLFLRGVYHRYRNKMSDAETIFEDLSRKFPADIPVSMNLALCLAESTDKVKLQRGLDLAELVVRQAPKQPDAYAVAGWLYYKNNRLDDAEKALYTASSGGRVALDSAYYLSRLLVDRGKYEDAYKILKAALAEKGPFVKRGEAQKLFDDVDKKVPKEKKEEKKPDEKKDDKKGPEKK